MTKIGYARVSTFDQNLNSQLDELKKCLDYLREGDTLVIWKLCSAK